AHPRLKSLYTLQYKALVINLELIWHFTLPKPALQLLPKRASTLLPRSVVKELR
ncbi:MAG: hypothetical protein SGPRY_011795, partial [Prymnesium sp.]